jgi:hypothetical protein
MNSNKLKWCQNYTDLWKEWNALQNNLDASVNEQVNLLKAYEAYNQHQDI